MGKNTGFEVRSAKLEEFDKTINLVNHVFRESTNEEPTMEKEFPLLLNKSNIENMIVGIENNEIVTDVNYLIQDVSIQGEIIKVGFVGGVCTHPKAQAKGYATKVLDFVEEKMLQDGVDVISISGTRSLYTRRKCSKVKSFYKYTVKNEDINLDSSITIKDFKEEDLNKYIALYNQNSTKFIRSKDQFKALLEASTIPWGTYSYKKLSIKKDNEVIGYLVLRIVDEEVRHGKVIELILDNKYKGDILKYVANLYNLEYVFCHVHVKDYHNHFEGYDKKELDYQGGTLKVINFEKLMKSLNLYFNKYVEDDILSKIDFKEENNQFIIEYNKDDEHEKYTLENIEELNKLLFEHNDNDYGEIKELKNIHKFVTNVFPIDFVWTENLNYQ